MTCVICLSSDLLCLVLVLLARGDWQAKKSIFFNQHPTSTRTALISLVLTHYSHFANRKMMSALVFLIICSVKFLPCNSWSRGASCFSFSTATRKHATTIRRKGGSSHILHYAAEDEYFFYNFDSLMVRLDEEKYTSLKGKRRMFLMLYSVFSWNNSKQLIK